MSANGSTLWQIVYRSESCIDPLDQFTALTHILEMSTRNNERDGLTGLLVQDESSFYQALEGDRDRVSDCYLRIVSDPRHRDLQLLIHEEIPERRFARWSMGFIDAMELVDYPELHDLLMSADPEKVIAGLTLIGREHGLIQRAVPV